MSGRPASARKRSSSLERVSVSPKVVSMMTFSATGEMGEDWAEQTGEAERIAQNRTGIRIVDNLIGNKKVSCENLVRSRGLEPPRLAALAPQASASASSATTAMTSIVKAME